MVATVKCYMALSDLMEKHLFFLMSERALNRYFELIDWVHLSSNSPCAVSEFILLQDLLKKQSPLLRRGGEIGV